MYLQGGVPDKHRYRCTIEIRQGAISDGLCRYRDHTDEWESL